MKIGSVEIQEFEMTSIEDSALVVPGLPVDGSLGLAFIKNSSVLEFGSGRTRNLVAFTGGSSQQLYNLSGSAASQSEAYPPYGWTLVTL